MAYKVGAVSGIWSAAGTWESVTNTPTLHASTNVTVDDTARYTATYTAPSTSDAATGVLIYINAIGSAGTLTTTLQESSVDTAAAVSVAVTSLRASAWNYLRLPSAYTFTTTGAGAYRWKIAISGGSGTTNAAADSGGSLYAFLSTDNRTGVPASTDDAYIAATVTVDGTQAIGSGSVLASSLTGDHGRYLGFAVAVVAGGVLTWDTAASASLTTKGNRVVYNGGEWRQGSVATPIPAGITATCLWDMNGTQGNYCGRLFNGGKLTLCGTAPGYFRTTLVSGVGTAASPLVTADPVDWSVGDEIVIAGTATYAGSSQNEYRFVITKNSATSYVLSSTSGGAETALTHTHVTGATIAHLTRNVVWSSTDSTRRQGGFYWGANTTAGNVVLSGARLNDMSAPISGTNVFWGRGKWTEAPGNTISCSNTVVNNYTVTADIGAGARLSLSGIIVTRFAGTIGSGCSCDGATISHLMVFDNPSLAFAPSASGATFNNMFIAGASSAGVLMSGASNTYNSPSIQHSARGIALNATAVGTTFRTGMFGTIGANRDADVDMSAVVVDLLFYSCTFGSATTIRNYRQAISGSEIAFHRLNNTDRRHRWYTPYGSGWAGHSTLTYNDPRTAGNGYVVLLPESSDPGMSWEFSIIANAEAIAYVTLFARRNVALGTDVATVELFLPGSTTADASYTLPTTAGAWLPVTLSAYYSGTVSGFATVRVTVKSVASGAQLDVADIFGGDNALSQLLLWSEGKPSPLMVPTAVNISNLWSAPTAGAVSGSALAAVRDGLKLDEFLALK